MGLKCWIGLDESPNIVFKATVNGQMKRCLSRRVRECGVGLGFGGHQDPNRFRLEEITCNIQRCVSIAVLCVDVCLRVDH